MKDIDTYLKEKAAIVNSALDEYLRKEMLSRISDSSERVFSVPDSIIEAMRYAVLGEGKRIRPILAIASCEALSGNQQDILPAACGIELIHAYSLIHDDLPSMDNDDLRRGKPTVHKVYGEAIAILTGDALLTLAFELMSTYPEGDESSRAALHRKKLEIIRMVSSACGTAGLIGGQVIDLQSEGKRIGLSELENLHLMKTGALMTASLMAGAIMADVTDENKKLILNYADAIGLAFQITDDLLDAEGTAEAVGKATRKDTKKKKAAFPSLHGIKKSHEIAENLIEDAKKIIQPLGESGKILSYIAEFIVTRSR